jgi:polyisoprenyl-teichoic acid--peptidoglycan teichoic acid transferase
MGGPRMLNSAIEYNLGVRPDNYAIFNLDSFSHLIDDLGGIHVTVLDNVTAITARISCLGCVLLNGEQALCYMRLRLGDDEFSRNLRQQDVLAHRLPAHGGGRQPGARAGTVRNLPQLD